MPPGFHLALAIGSLALVNLKTSILIQKRHPSQQIWGCGSPEFLVLA